MDVTIAGLFEDSKEEVMFLMNLFLKSKADAFNKQNVEVLIFS